MADDRAFFQRRLHEELTRAKREGDPYLRLLHWRWAHLYRERLNRLRRVLEAAW
jgi:hypothetical protein